MLDTLQELWRATRAPAIASRIQALSALDPTDPIRALGTATKSTLVQHLIDARSGPLDARWADLILPWLETPPFSNAFEVWHHALAVLDRQADPRTFEAIRVRATESQAAFKERFGSLNTVRLHTWVHQRVRWGFPSIARPIATLTPAHLQALGPVDAWIAERQAGQTLRSELLHRAAAGDDTALFIYADALSVEDDVRGEFIHLSALTQRTPEQRERLTVLMKDWRALVGDLHSVVLSDGLLLRRGLPVELVVRPAAPVLRASVFQSADWASVEHLEIRRNPQRRSDPTLVFAPHARRLQSVTLPDLATLVQLLAGSGSNPGVHTVILREARPGPWERRSHSLEAIPNLKTLRILQHGPRHSRVTTALKRQFPEVKIL